VVNDPRAFLSHAAEIKGRHGLPAQGNARVRFSPTHMEVAEEIAGLALHEGIAGRIGQCTAFTKGTDGGDVISGVIVGSAQVDRRFGLLPEAAAGPGDLERVREILNGFGDLSQEAARPPAAGKHLVTDLVSFAPCSSGRRRSPWRTWRSAINSWSSSGRWVGHVWLGGIGSSGSPPSRQRPGRGRRCCLM
jgi:hypothetical protein